MKKYIESTQSSNLNNIGHKELSPIELIDLINEEVKDLRSQGHKDISYTWDVNYTGSEFLVKFLRLETDVEYQLRCEKELLIQQKKRNRLKKLEERERKQYERLKEKFESY